MQVMSYNVTLGTMTIPQIMSAGRAAFNTILASSGGAAASLAGVQCRRSSVALSDLARVCAHVHVCLYACVSVRAGKRARGRASRQGMSQQLGR